MVSLVKTSLPEKNVLMPMQHIATQAIVTMLIDMQGSHKEKSCEEQV